MKKHLSISLASAAILTMATGCADGGDKQILGFPKIQETNAEATAIDPDALGRPEHITADDSVIVVLDFFDNQYYSTFDAGSGKLKARFGTIGEGPGEIPHGTQGALSGGRFVVFNDRPVIYGEYNPMQGDSSYVRKKINYPTGLMLSRINRLTDSTLVAMGSYNETYKYILLHERLGAIDSIIEISTKGRADMNMYHKFLGEQGNMAVSTDKKRIAATTNYSDNIDFLSLADGHLSIIAQDRQRDAELTPQVLGEGDNRTIPALDKPMGYLDVCANDSYVFALYSPEEFAACNYHSPYILVYDWNGNKITILDLRQNVLAIAVNSSTLFLLTIDDEGEYAIKQVSLRQALYKS